MKCSGCNCNISVTQKRVKCIQTNCLKIFHQECVNYIDSPSLRGKWICPICIERSKNTNNTPPDNNSTSSSTVGLIESQNSILSEIRELRREMKEKFEHQQVTLDGFNTIITNVQRDLQSMNSTISSLRVELDDVTNSLKFLSDSYDDQNKTINNFQRAMSEMHAERSYFMTRLKETEDKLGQLEQQARNNNIEIQCVPERRNENLLKIIHELATTISIDLPDRDILGFHRTAKMTAESKRPRNIVVKLSSPRIRDNVLAAVKTYNRKHSQDKLNSSHVGITGDKHPIFIVEHLSTSNKKLHAATRLAAKEKQYKFVWVRNGRIFVRKDEHSNSRLVNNVEFLKNL